MTDKIDLDELSRLEKLATNAPWETAEEVPGAIIFDDPKYKRPMNLVGKDLDGYFVLMHHPDADLIAALRNAAPSLLSALRAADELAEAAEEIEGTIDTHVNSDRLVYLHSKLAAFRAARGGS